MSEGFPGAEAAAATFARLASEIREARKKVEVRKQGGRGRFNIFTTLLKAQDEVRLHTRFLHCLLDPEGGHELGDRFLRLFFATLEEHPAIDHEGEDGLIIGGREERRGWRVAKEASRPPFGQLDLLLEHGSRIGIAIENKIYHHEGNEQLARYDRALAAAYGSSRQILYLTLDGRRAESAGGASYLRLSYSGHILAWLEKCLLETPDKPELHAVLLQYRDVVMQLCGLALDHKDMKPIIDFIRGNPDIIRYRAEIARAADEAVLQAWDEIESGITAELVAMGYQVTRSPHFAGRFGAANSGLVITPPPGCPLRDAPFEIWVERDEREFGVGPCIDRTAEKQSDSDRKLIRELAALVPRDGVSERFPIGWKNIIAGTEDEHFADVVMAPDIPAICGKILGYLHELEGIYTAVRAGLPPRLPSEGVD